MASQIDVKALIPGAGKHPAPVPQVMDCRVGQRAVIRYRGHSDIGRRDGQSFTQNLLGARDERARPVDTGHRNRTVGR